MDGRLIAAAIPGFLVFIAVEAWLLRRRADPAYQLEDSVADLSLGIGQQTVQVFTRAFELAVYTFVWSRVRVFDAPASAWWTWVAAFVGVDLAFYLFHRASHRVKALWAIHAVHHQSEEFNLSVALRQAWLEPLAILPFHCVLALLGVPPAVMLLAYTVNTLYQFFVHTRGVRTLGVVERVMNTPSHHRVHHAVNPAYIDKNYGGMFIVWDRLFGTFVREDEEPAYGSVTPLRSLSPLWANTVLWVDLGRTIVRAPRWVDKLRAPFMPPEWRPAELGGNVTIPEVSRETRPKYGTDKRVSPYALASFVVLVAGSSALLVIAPLVGTIASLMFAACVLLGLSTVAGLVEERRWARPLEVARLLVQPIVALYVSWGTPLMALATAITAVVSLASLVALYASRRRADALPSTPAPAR